MINREALLVYGITDRTWLRGQTIVQQVEEAVLGGATMIQYREKHFGKEEMIKEAREIQEVCKKHDIPFIINDYVDLAKEIEADGVHVGQEDLAVTLARELLGPEKIIGVTAKTVEQARKAQNEGADYIGSGAVFGSSTKENAKKMSHDLLQQICESVDIPVVAIGGIHKDNILTLKNRKIAGVAVISGIFGEENILESTKEIKEKMMQLVEQGRK